MRSALSTALCIGAAALSGLALARSPHHPAAFVVPAEVPSTGQPLFERHVVGANPGGTSHAASIVETKSGRRAFWFAGTREGARDVALMTASFDGTRWTLPVPATDAARTARDLGRRTKTVGNSVAFRHPNGELWLVYVSVSVGGWAGSRLNLMRSTDDGATWTTAERLRVAPFLNLSNLVKQPPVIYADGTIGLGVYHEFARKFPELVLLEPGGAVIGKRRMGAGDTGIQPAIAVLGPTEAIALMRKARRSITGMRRTDTADAGWTWSPVAAAGLPNPGGAVAARPLGQRALVAAFNDDEQSEKDITLATSADGGAIWQRRAVVAQTSAPRFEVSYPYLIAGSDGIIDLVYTHTEDATIRHVRFNRAWLEAQRRSGR